MCIKEKKNESLWSRKNLAEANLFSGPDETEEKKRRLMIGGEKNILREKLLRFPCFNKVVIERMAEKP